MTRKFHVVVSPVREVSLVGAANLSYWRGKLAMHDLHPSQSDRRATMMLSACEARFKGIRFRELSISVFVAREPGSPSRDGVLLLRAFNSIRFFAWVERTFFATPYYFQRIALSPDAPAFLRLGGSNEPIVEALMGDRFSNDADQSSPTTVGDWQGPIFLPNLRDASNPASRLFFASLTGECQALAFDAARDRFCLGPSVSDPIVPLLTAAEFEPREWILRTAATHGKSKTIRRTAGQESDGFADGRMLA